jgi:hypothetical protein
VEGNQPGAATQSLKDVRVSNDDCHEKSSELWAYEKELKTH